jgi:hypothetical protein
MADEEKDRSLYIFFGSLVCLCASTRIVLLCQLIGDPKHTQRLSFLSKRWLSLSLSMRQMFTMLEKHIPPILCLLSSSLVPDYYVNLPLCHLVRRS